MTDTKSRTLTAVISCQRNEALWLCEWVAFHRSIGFDKIFVASNDCTDGSDLILDRLEALGEVIHIRHSPPEGIAPQVAGCGLLLDHPAMEDVEWALHIDTDEFLNVTCGLGKIHDLLAAVSDADCIAIAWRMFGTKGQRVWPGGDLLENCTKTERSVRPGRTMHKSMFRPDRFGSVFCHMPKDPKSRSVLLKNTANVAMRAAALFKDRIAHFRPEDRRMFTWENACINHYAIRSEDIFLLKNLRGDGMALEHTKYFKGSKFWTFADQNAVEDLSILRHGNTLRERLAWYRSDLEVQRLEAAAWADFQRLREEELFQKGGFGWKQEPNAASAETGKKPRKTSPVLPDTSAATRLLLDHLPFARSTTVVDVGANPINDVPYAALLAMGGCQVIGFEPQPEAFAALQAQKSASETYFPFAVGDGSEQELKIYRSSGMTSVLEPYAPTYRLLGKSRLGQITSRSVMQTRALDEVAEIGHIDLLKIDIQGGESAVFRGADRKLEGTSAIIVELRYLRLYQDEPMSWAVDMALREKGFILHKFLFNKSMPIKNSQQHRLDKNAGRDQLIDGDAVFVRDLTKLDTFEDGMLVHLSILASGVFASHTVAIACLDELSRRGRIPADLPQRYVDLLPSRLRKAE